MKCQICGNQITSEDARDTVNLLGYLGYVPRHVTSHNKRLEFHLKCVADYITERRNDEK